MAVKEAGDRAGQDTLWHSMAPKEALSAADSLEEGLALDEAARRLSIYGENRPTPPRRRKALERLAAQFNSLLIFVLIGAAAVSGFLGHMIDTAVILAVVLVNGVIGFVQEGRAEKALEAIRDMLSLKATVRREGVRRTVPAETLVPGDIVFIEAGDKIPADLRLLRVKNLRVLEAALTGESEPIEKTADAVPTGTALAERSSMAYAGTLAVYGQAVGIVAETGARTEIGRISGMLSSIEELTTPLIQQMHIFARWLTLAILGFASFTFLIGIFFRGYDAAEMFMASVALAVAAIPEGLPAILTVTLAIGVRRMAGRNAIIRRLPAVETLGSVSIICSDKTGTLTRNELTVQRVLVPGRVYEVEGVGYAPEGGVHAQGTPVAAEEDAALAEFARACLLCNDAALRHDCGEWHMSGDPTEGALLAFALKAGLDAGAEKETWRRQDIIPFESEHRFMATLNSTGGGGKIFMKGAPEKLLERCREEWTPSGCRPIDLEGWHKRIEELACGGYRVLALAVKKMPEGKNEIAFKDVEDGLSFLGVAGIIDPPRQEALEAIRHCRVAGVKVKMITGDHAGTASAIAKALGFAHPEAVMTGTNLDALEGYELQRAAEDMDVFARAAPENKLKLVEALQARGHIIAMTGDGVNDAPALKRADVGVAMGIKGTEAAKEAAEMVLADDNFASIANAVEEGRTVYDNLRKAITFLLPVNGGESFTIVMAVMLGLALPMSPLQLLWINMVSSVTLAMALAFEPVEPGTMSRPPRRREEPLLSRFIVWRILLVSAVFVVGVFGMFTWYRAQGADIETARTVAVNTLVMLEVFYLFSVRYLHGGSLTWEGVKGTRHVLIAVAIVAVLQFLLIYAPFMQMLFGTKALGLFDLMLIFLVGACGFAVIEIEKLISRKAMGFGETG